jgi:hypothetical protein
MGFSLANFKPVLVDRIAVNFAGQSDHVGTVIEGRRFAATSQCILKECPASATDLEQIVVMP